LAVAVTADLSSAPSSPSFFLEGDYLFFQVDFFICGAPGLEAIKV
jgi:hypothetical protein